MDESGAEGAGGTADLVVVGASDDEENTVQSWFKPWSGAVKIVDGRVCALGSALEGDMAGLDERLFADWGLGNDGADDPTKLESSAETDSV